MRIYLDHNATTPLRAEVTDAMARILRDVHGNPSSVHAEGARARAEIERAREQVASLVGAAAREIVITGSATEANNLAIEGMLAARGGGHVVSSTAEHPSVLEPLARLEARGVPVTRVPVDADGRLDPDAVLAALRPDTALVTLLWANNETGVLQPVETLVPLLCARGVAVHLDATQCLGKHPVDVRALPVDLLSASAHKFNGPKGTGFLYRRDGLELEPFVRGGPQERRQRGGTENVAGIVGLGVAAALAGTELAARSADYRALRDRLWQGLEAKVPALRRNGLAEHVLCNTLNVEFVDTPGDVVLQALDLEGVAVSAGAACASGSVEPSHVLVAMGRTPAQAHGSLRFSVGHGVDASQIDRVLAVLPDLVARVREAAA